MASYLIIVKICILQMYSDIDGCSVGIKPVYCQFCLNGAPNYRLFCEKSELRSQLCCLLLQTYFSYCQCFFPGNPLVDSVLVAASLCVGSNDVLPAMTGLY